MDNDEDIIQFQLEADEIESIRAFADTYKPDYSCRPIAIKRDNKFILDAYLPKIKFDRASRSVTRGKNLKIKFVNNASEITRKRQLDVGQGDRYKSDKSRFFSVPRGLGIKE